MACTKDFNFCLMGMSVFLPVPRRGINILNCCNQEYNHICGHQELRDKWWRTLVGHQINLYSSLCFQESFGILWKLSLQSIISYLIKDGGEDEIKWDTFSKSWAWHMAWWVISNTCYQGWDCEFHSPEPTLRVESKQNIPGFWAGDLVSSQGFICH